LILAVLAEQNTYIYIYTYDVQLKSTHIPNHLVIPTRT
jgi:hypothetical protein